MLYRYRTVMLLACLSEQPNRCSTVLTVPHLPVQSDRPYAYGTGTDTDTSTDTDTGTGTGTKKYSTGIGPPARTVPVPCSYRRFRGSGAAGADYLNTNSMPAALPVLVELSVHMPLRYTQRVRVVLKRNLTHSARYPIAPCTAHSGAHRITQYFCRPHPAATQLLAKNLLKRSLLYRARVRHCPPDKNQSTPT